MSKLFFYDDAAPQRVYVPVMGPTKRRYGFFKFLFDVVMTIATSGFWLIWIFVREMRKR